MTKAVILAAGRGERLFPSTEKYPKPLTPILGKPMLEHILYTLQHAGITRCIIVTGYLGHLIRRRIGDGSKFNLKIQYSHNSRYAHGNAISLKTAQKFLTETESFLLLMADHIVEEKIVKKALENINRKPLLCVDHKPRHPPLINDATKVLVDPNGFIADIGKHIPVWNSVDTGVFLLDGTIFQIIEQMEKKVSPLTITKCIKQLILDGKPLWACDVSNLLWFDIDTPEDVAFVESFLRGVLKCQENGMA